MSTALPVIWAGIVVFAIVMYVIMDGFDLGIGILFTRFGVGREPRYGDEYHRAGVGRQRNLVGTRRRRVDGGVSPGLRHHIAGVIRAR